MNNTETPIAHVCGKKCIHSVEDHLINTAKRAAHFASDFGATQWGYLAGLWHDLGKYSPAFQSMIRIATGIDEETSNSTRHLAQADSSRPVRARGLKLVIG